MAHNESILLNQTSITEITTNKSKMERLQGPFAKSYTRLNNEQCDCLRKLYTELEGDPFHPLFADGVFPIVLQILEYLPDCPQRRTELLSSLHQLINEHPYAKTDKAVNTEHTRSNSKKRGFTRTYTIPLDSPSKRTRHRPNTAKTLPYEKIIMEVPNSQQGHQVCAARMIGEPEGKLPAAFSQASYHPITSPLPIDEDQCLSQPAVPNLDFEATSSIYYDRELENEHVLVNGLNLTEFP